MPRENGIKIYNVLGLGNSLIFGSQLEQTGQTYSLYFDGTNDKLTLGNVLNVGTADFSISFWINVPFDSGTSQYLVTKIEDGNNAVWHGLSGGGIKSYAQFKAGGTTVDSVTGNSMVPIANTWIHICGTADRDGNYTMYVNGTTSTYGRTGTDMDNDSTNLDNTGGWSFMAYSTSYSDGYMTDVAIYNVALSSTHVGEIYNSGSPFDLTTHSQSSALTGYWRFNEGSGSTLADEIGSNDLTIVGATWSINVP